MKRHVNCIYPMCIQYTIPCQIDWYFLGKEDNIYRYKSANWLGWAMVRVASSAGASCLHRVGQGSAVPAAYAGRVGYIFHPSSRERGGSVVECRTPEREVRGSRPTAAVLCP